MAKTLLSIILVCILIPCPAQQQFRRYSRAEISSDLALLVSQLKRGQPGYDRYYSVDDQTRYADSIMQTLADSMSAVEAYRAFKPLVSRIGCLHTGLQLPSAIRRELDAKPNLLPLQLYFEGDRAFIVKNISGNPHVRTGSEVTAINGKSIPYLLSRLLPAIPSDGYNTTMKYLALYHQLPTWYRSIIEDTGSFLVRTVTENLENEYLLTGKTYDELAVPGFLKEYEYKEPLAFRIEDGVGYLDIRSFSNSAIRGAKQRFKRFIRRSFKEIDRSGIRHLIVDLRYNTGGTDGNAAYLSSFFFDQPYRYWDRIEVTPEIAHDVKGPSLLFYRKPKLKDGKWLWRPGRTTREFNYTALQYPRRNNFNGETILLTNGFCMSSCADVAAILSSNGKAKIMGEETGGGYQGNTSGIMPQLTLPNTGLVVTVPVLEYHNAVDTTKNTGRGVMPDYRVIRTLPQVISNEDVVMQAARAMIKTSIQ